MSSTQANIAWYYVGVAVLLLFGQNYVLNTAHQDALARLAAKSALVVTVPVVATAAPGAVAAPAASPSTVVAAPASTLNPTPAPEKVPAKEATLAAAKAAPATETKAEAQAAKSPEPIIASAAPAAAKALPVALAFRSEPFKKGKIVTLTNTSKGKLDCKVTVKRPGTGETQSFKVTVAASGEVRLVGTEGWAFKSGDQIEVAQSGFRSKTTSVP
jgi:hypothetical protein